MQRFIIVRCFYAIIVLFAVSIIVFVLARASGNPIDTMLPLDATPEQQQAFMELWGLDKSYPEQYFDFLANAFRGDFGDSVKWADRTAMGLVIERFPLTLKLGAVAIGISVLIAVPIGVLSAVKKDTIFDLNGKVFALLGQATPPFWLGIMLIWIFAVEVDWFPTGGDEGILWIVLPAITLGWFQVAALMRLVRSAMLEVLETEYVTLARVKGIHPGMEGHLEALSAERLYTAADPVRHSCCPGDDRGHSHGKRCSACLAPGTWQSKPSADETIR